MKVSRNSVLLFPSEQFHFSWLCGRLHCILSSLNMYNYVLRNGDVGCVDMLGDTCFLSGFFRFFFFFVSRAGTSAFKG